MVKCENGSALFFFCLFLVLLTGYLAVICSVVRHDAQRVLTSLKPRAVDQEKSDIEFQVKLCQNIP